MPFVLPDLTFEPTSLEPWLSAESFSYHHGKHHAAYVSKLNAAVSGTELDGRPLEELIRVSGDVNPAVFNNAAQHFNHDRFWLSLSPTEQTPEDQLLEKIESDFGSFETLKEKFSGLAGGLFGSGWVWLMQTTDDRLEVRQYQNAETPGGTDDRGLLPLDVWEHAYYIDHRNDRAKFIAGFWSHINWKSVAERLA